MTENKDYNLRAYTHTLQMASRGCALPLEDVDAKPYMTKKVRFTTSEFRTLLFPINVNKYVGRDVDSYSELLLLLDEIRKDLEVDDWYIDRQDIAIDTEISYNELFKLNNMLISLFGVYRGKPEKITDTRGQADKQKRQLLYSDRKIELAIYDKKLESGGKYPYSRCEFRFKLLSPNTDITTFKNIYRILDTLPKCLAILEKSKIESLYNLWKIESSPDYANTPVKSLPEFFRRYGNDIFTTNIARGLHDRILQGKYAYWIRSYRRSGGNIHFITKTELTTYCRELKAAVQKYENNYCKNGVTPPIISHKNKAA